MNYKTFFQTWCSSVQTTVWSEHIKHNHTLVPCHTQASTWSRTIPDIYKHIHIHKYACEYTHTQMCFMPMQSKTRMRLQLTHTRTHTHGFVKKSNKNIFGKMIDSCSQMICNAESRIINHNKRIPDSEGGKHLCVPWKGCLASTIQNKPLRYLQHFCLSAWLYFDFFALPFIISTK